MYVSGLDLFCGAGGLTYGIEAAGVVVEAGIDADPDCRYAYEANNDAVFIRDDIEEIAEERPEVVEAMLAREADATAIVGCAPCQPFSSLTNGSGGEDHEKWGLLEAFGTIVEEVEPDVVAMENVVQVQRHSVYDDFVSTLDSLGYYLNPPENREVFCPEYGIPQNRKRLVLLASKEGPIRLEDPIHEDEEDYPWVEDEIGGLDPIEAGETHDDDPLHRAQGLSETNKERIQHSEPGGTWEDWPERLKLECHKKASGSSYTPVYGRMEKEAPAPTITTQFYNYGSGRFGHFDTEQDRPISIREGAMLQTFKEDYEFFESWDDMSMDKVGRLIGNAVPPKLGEIVGRSILAHLAGETQVAPIDGYASSAPR